MSDRVKISPVESDGVTCLQTRNLAGSEAKIPVHEMVVTLSGWLCLSRARDFCKGA